MLLALLFACTDEKPDTGDQEEVRTAFPDDFLWGTAVAGFQVDAGCPTVDPEICEDRASDWYQWVSDPELVADESTYLSGEPISTAPGHYELYPEDLALAAGELGNDAFRTSVEWSRLFPDGAAEAATTTSELADHADPVALAHYDAYFDAILDAGLTPLVTINHYTLPLWLHDGKACHLDIATCEDKGWADPGRLIPALSLFSAFVAERWGDRVDLWGTINEPVAIVVPGYLLPSEDRTNPPGIQDADVAFDVFFNLIEGHAAIYDALKASDGVDADGDGDASRIGLVANLAAIAPVDPESELDAQGVAHADYVYNRVFLNGAILGDLDRDLDGVAEEHRDDLEGRMDFLGVNYYTRLTVRGLEEPLIEGYPMFDFFPEVLWEEYPEGIADVVAIGTEYGLPTIITENGTQANDESGETFLRPHLDALLGAMNDGHDVQGYFYWSLMDNYEWNHGTTIRMGLYEVDPTTKARTLRPLGQTYAEIVASGTP